MNRDDSLRDRLLLLAECSNPHKPFNVKRKSMLSKQGSKNSGKLSMQDFVRMDPGYTPDIEHLVFPTRKRNPQQVAPINPAPVKARSRLAEMFALSRHLQQRSTDRETKSRNPVINRSIDSILEPSAAASGLRSNETVRRWVSTAEEPVRQNSIGGTRLSPTADNDMATTRGPNVSVLHLRNTSEPWEKKQTTSSSYPVTTTTSSSRSYFSSRSSSNATTVPPPPLKKHQSLGGVPSQSYKWSASPNFHSGGDQNSPDRFVSTSNSCNRELSPVRWCDREVDGVYLGRSGWVQVQQRSLDENRRISYTTTSSSLQSRRTGIKLAEYHCTSEPAKRLEEKKPVDSQRPGFLSLPTKEYDRKALTPPPRNILDTFSPPPATPIISPPPAFQDGNSAKMASKSRTFFGGKTFLPRSNAIEDSDGSPPPSPPPIKWTTTAPMAPQPQPRRLIPKPVTTPIAAPTPKIINRIPQTKSMEDTTAARRSQFVQRYGESSSSSSSSMGFRSLDSNFNRPTMPRLSENTDSSVDVYEDADDEDNNSSSINISIANTLSTNTITDYNRIREKISPTCPRNRTPHHRTPPRRSPAGSDTNKPTCSSPSSSSTSSNEFLSRSPPPIQQPVRRSAPPRQYQFAKPLQEDPTLARVRRSRSLQLPERKAPSYRDPYGAPLQQTVTRISPQQHPDVHRNFKVINPKRQSTTTQSLDKSDVIMDENILREAEVVTGFLYGNRSRAAAQALLMHRYNNNNLTKEEKNKEQPKPNTNGLTVYYVGNANKERQRLLLRGSTSPNLANNTKVQHEQKNPCNPESCDFWPHCAHRESLNREAQFMMRSSQSYPTHQRSLDSTTADNNRKLQQRRVIAEANNRRKTSSVIDRERRPSPNNKGPTTGSLVRREISPKNTLMRPTSVFGNNVALSSSSSDVWKSSKSTVKGSGASTPIDEVIVSPPTKTTVVIEASDEKPREMIMTRPGSAPGVENSGGDMLVSQQRSMSLPKSFLSPNYQQDDGADKEDDQSGTGSQTVSHRRGTESLGSSPGFNRKITTPETSHTAPVTPLHEGTRRRSPLGGAVRRAKASSTPQLLDAPGDSRKWSKDVDISNEFSLNPSGAKELGSRRNLPANTAESVLQKFRKTFSLRFQKKSSKDICMSPEVAEPLSEILGEPSEDDSPQHIPTTSSSTVCQTDLKEEQTEQKHSRFGPLIWRGSKERKKLNKAARNAKCNSGDSGIQIEMVPSCGGSGGGGGGDSSESHDTDPPGDDLDSPPAVRRRPPHGKSSRPHSDLLNQILIDKFKADLKQRAHKHQQVRRTRSDLGGQRLLHWDPRSSYRRLMSSPSPLRGRPQSPRKKPPDAPGGVQLRHTGHRRGQLRRSLSQPLDIDKLSPLMRIKTAGLRPGGSNVLSEDEHDARVGTSDDEMMSDSESSIASLNERKKSLEQAMDEEMIILAEAVFDHVAIEADELAFRAGDVIEVLETNNREWWWGSTNNKTGWFPAQFVRLRVSQEDTVEDCLAAMESGKSVSSQIRRRTSISLLSNDQVRTSVVRELVHTERDFVKVLQDVVEGYISECRKRTDMFSQDQIATIFINLEDILRFQSGFLKDLELCINWEEPYRSCVGGCFLKHRAGFKMYSDYCNSHPLATATLQELYEYNNYSKFFEACRLMRGLIEIPLDGYLLTPVQRICKYPLQLAELLKYTKADHKDYDDIKQALEAMRDVAMLINERKRRMESLEKLAAWQQRVEGWEGDDLIEVSSQLIYQGEVVRVTTGMWTNNITLFLFDHQIVYCKKDILKRNTYVYKGRICLDTCEIIDVPDGKDVHLGVSVRHAIKLYSCVRDKWLLFCCRSSKDKLNWLHEFAVERKLVAQDRDDGLEFPPAARQLARLAARCQRRPPRKPRNGKNYKHDSGYMGSSLQLNTTSQNSNSLGRKVGTWFTFGANKKTRHQHQHDVS